jgi:hypothetical protein
MGECMQQKEAVQSGVAAVKALELMPWRQSLNPQSGHFGKGFSRAGQGAIEHKVADAGLQSRLAAGSAWP